jgi:hypothetical protein
MNRITSVPISNSSRVRLLSGSFQSCMALLQVIVNASIFHQDSSVGIVTR